MGKNKGVLAMVPIFVGLIILTSGCGASRLTVIRPVLSSTNPTPTIQVNPVKATATSLAPMGLPNKIRFLVLEELRKSGAFDTVDPERGMIALDIDIVSFDAGSQMERWFWGGLGNMGEGDLQLETTFIDTKNGQELGKIRTQGTITSGVMGGSIDNAYHNAVKQIVQYTVLKFGKRKYS